MDTGFIYKFSLIFVLFLGKIFKRKRIKMFFVVILLFFLLSSMYGVDISENLSPSITFIDGQYFYYRSIRKPYYIIDQTAFNTDNEYSEIRDLQFKLNHSTPLLYELKFQASCSSLIKNEQTLIRFKYDNLWLTNPLELSSPVEGLVTSCSKVAQVYFSSGFHTIDVEIRTTGKIKIYFGELYIKLTQFNPKAQVNLHLLDRS